MCYKELILGHNTNRNIGTMEKVDCTDLPCNPYTKMRREEL
jgi:hypothetical protein